MINIIGLILSSGMAAIFSFLLQVIVARNSSLDFYGFFSSYSSIILMSIPISTLGLGHYLIKEYSIIQDDDEIIDINFIVVVIFSSFFGFILTAVLIYVFFSNIDLISALLISISVFSFCFHELTQSYLVGTRNKAKLILWQPYLNFIRFLSALVYILCLSLFDIQGLIWLSVLSLLLVLLPIYIFRNNSINNNISKLSRDRLVLNAKGGFWFCLVGVFYIIYSQVNIFYIGKMIEIKVAGYFNIGYTFLLMSLLLPNTIYYKYLLPKLHYWSKNDLKKLNNFYIWGGIYCFLSGCLVLLVLYFMAEFIVVNFYGSKFIEAVSVFKGVILSIPLFYLSIHLGVFSYLGNAQKYKVLVLFLVTIFSVFLNYFLILFYGLSGALVGFNLVIIFMSMVYFIINKFFVFNSLRGV